MGTVQICLDRLSTSVRNPLCVSYCIRVSSSYVKDYHNNIINEIARLHAINQQQIDSVMGAKMYVDCM